MRQDSISLHRHELYNLVWSEPMTRLARKYGFSDVWLAKICKKYDIPRPGRGYWARKQAGERVLVARLPKCGDDPIIHINVYPTRSNRNTERRNNRPVVQVPKNIVVPGELTDPHSYTIETAETLASSQASDTGILSNRKHGLDIRVSRECVDRALRIMDTLVKVLITMGFIVKVSKGSTRVCIGDESIEISLREEVKRRRLGAAEHDLEAYYRFGYNLYADRAVPSGILSLIIEDKAFPYGTAPRRTWRDTEAKRLEECLSSFISGLIRAAHEKKTLKEKDTAPTHTAEDEIENETGDLL